MIDFGKTAAPAPPPAVAPPAQPHTAAIDFGPPKSAAINFATQTKPGAASFIEKVGDYLDVPLAYLEAGIHDLGEPGPGGNPFAIREGSHTKQVTHDLTQSGVAGGGPHNVAQNDVYFRPGSLQRVLADPSASANQKATAQWFLKHPWAAGGADFAAEFANPSNLALGPIAGAAGKVIRPVARLATKLPFIGEGIDAAVNLGKSLVDKYHPLRKIQNAAQVARMADAAARTATKHNAELQRSIYGAQGMFNGTTAEERFEIWRRAHGGQPMDPVQLAQQYPHTPGFTGKPGKLTDAELTQRAQLERAALDHLDQEQIQRGWVDNPDDLMQGYFPVRGKGGHFYDEKAFERAAMQFPGLSNRVGAAGLRFRGPNLNEKVFRSPDEILQANERMGGSLLANGADPANEFLAHLNKVSGNIALDEFIRRLVQEAPQAAQEVTGAKLGFHIPGGTVTKNGISRNVSSGEATLAKGLQIAERNARSAASSKAIQEVAQRFGMQPQDVARIARRLFPQETTLSGRIAELRQTPNTIQRGVGSLTKGSKPLTLDQLGQLNARGAVLADRLTDPERPIADEYRKLRDRFDRALQPKYREQMLQQLSPSGFHLLKNVPGLSGLQRLKYTEVAPELVKYLTDFGAPPKDANALGKFLDRFNALYRIGIVTNPIVHPFYNLLWAYLGEGGNPIRLSKVFRSGETALDKEAEHYGAHAYFNANSALGGSNAQMLLGTFSQAQGLIGKADWMLSRLSDANRALVFDRLERNMATELWDDLAKKNIARGMNPEDAKRLAGEQVRKGFGDYDNITTAERSNITKALYFYPWTKTVIPFWIKAGIERPQLVNAPFRGMQTEDYLSGDPNAATNKPFTVGVGEDKSGQFVRKSAPLPQRWLEDVGEMIEPRVGGQADESAGLQARLNPLANIVRGHLTPVYGVPTDVSVQLANQEPQEPGVTPASRVVFNRAAPFGTQVEQIGQYAAQEGTPFGGNVGNLATAFREALNGQPQAIPQALLGGFVYAERTPQEQRQLNSLMFEFQRRYDHAFKLPPDARKRVQEEAYRAFRMKVDRLLKRQQSGG